MKTYAYYVNFCESGISCSSVILQWLDYRNSLWICSIEWSFSGMKFRKSQINIFISSHFISISASVAVYESSLLMNIQVVRISVNNHWLWGMWLTWRNFNCSTMWLVRKNKAQIYAKCQYAKRLFAFLSYSDLKTFFRKWLVKQNKNWNHNIFEIKLFILIYSTIILLRFLNIFIISPRTINFSNSF